MSAYNLCSCLSPQIRRFIDLRRLSGTDYIWQARLLGYFDRFLVEEGWNELRITREITDRYQQTLSRLAPCTRGNRFGVVKQFCEYLAGSNPLSYVPEPMRGHSSNRAYKPYIYNHDEIRALMTAASKLPPPGSLRPYTYHTMLGLLYSTGLRIGEMLALNLENFLATEQRLYVAEGKFRKARWIVLSDSSCQALQEYLARRLKKSPYSPDSPLLLNERRQRLCHPTVNQTFNHLVAQCGIAKSKRAGPRIHDLRHTFAVHRLLGWYRDGQDVNARLPALATFMGHVKISSTQVYLRPTAELFGEVHSRFHNHYLKNITCKGEKT